MFNFKRSTKIIIVIAGAALVWLLGTIIGFVLIDAGNIVQDSGILKTFWTLIWFIALCAAAITKSVILYDDLD